MKNFKSFTFLAAFLAVLCLVPAQAQVNTLVTTTLAAAVTSTSQTVFNFTATTGLVQNPGGISGAYIDREYVTGRLVNGAFVSVVRGQAGTKAATHASGALVFLAATNNLIQATGQSGTCTRGTVFVSPWIDAAHGEIYDCLGGVWVKGIGAASPQFRLMFPDPGATAYTSVNTSGTTVSSTTLYCTEVNLPYSKYLTGIAVLNGGTVGTDSQYVVLYDNAGTALANSAVAGTVTANASTYQARAFTTPFYAVGPNQYFACFQSNTGTDNVRMAVTGVNDNFLTKGQTGATFGTIPKLTVPTTFTTAVGPYVYLY
jgi:hypothetical protein